jgi:hypothetical protein
MQVVEAPTRLVQAVALVPSQTFCEHGFIGSLIGHAGLIVVIGDDTGWPEIVTHVPSFPAVLHAWHCPEHALLQQTPSTQFFAPPAEGQVAEEVQSVPSATIATTVMVSVADDPSESVAWMVSTPGMAPAV